MSDPLPHFRYHPNPVTTGAIAASDRNCACCDRPRGYIYVGPVYGINDLDESLCPWCIFDGSAARNLGASFSDSYPLLQAGVAESIVEEVNLRTPGYISWQQEWWLAHCDDACEFHGDATVQDVSHASQETKHHWISEYKQNEEGWDIATRGYQPGGSSALYKFVCRHCKQVLLGWDLC